MDFPEIFDPSRCVIFLGAGFSAEAKNKAGSNPPIGGELNRAIKKFAQIPEDDPSDLADTAGYAISQKLDLFGLLEASYTIKEVTDLQQKILTQPWWRIYTTNYDNSVSVFRAAKGQSGTRDVFDLTDEAPRQLRKGAVIHLHGSIAKCRQEEIDRSLVLSRRSYVEQRVKKSPWWDWFDRDVRTSQYIFFLGYDLNDFEPASYLIKYPGMKDRRHFILRNPGSLVAGSRLVDYGIRHSFEMRGFVDRLNRGRVATAPVHSNDLASFRYVDLTRDDKLPLKPTSAEIQELFAFGRLRFDAIRATAPRSEYVVFRSKSLESCRLALSESDTVVVHSKIGNGKSIVGDELKISLSQEGYQCFELRENITPLPQDIEFIKHLPAAIIFFPSYDSAIANQHLFSGMPESIKYVVEMPTSTLQVRMQEVLQKLHGKVARINVDKLDREDVRNLRDLLGIAGLSTLGNSAGIGVGLEFREFLLMSYEEPDIAKRLKAVINPLIGNEAAKKIIVSSAVFKSTGLLVDVSFIEDATGEDPYSILSGLGENVLELMEFGLDKLEPHSSVLSEHILKKYITSRDFTGAIFSLAAEAARRIDESSDFSSERFRKARSLLSSILRFGFLEDIIGRSADGRKYIGRLYEACRRDEIIKKEPLFWLQYSIFWQSEPRWDLAESHIVEAYSRGGSRPGFKTFQLDTNYLGLLCDLELNGGDVRPVSRFEKLMELVDICRSMIDDGNHRDHVTKAFTKMEPMVSKRRADFSMSQATRLTYALNLVIQRLEGLTPSEKALWGTEACKASLQNCVRILTDQEF